MKLNKQIAAAYNGCEVMYQEEMYILTGVSNFHDRIFLAENVDSVDESYHAPNDCQLILWPLSAITDEDAIEVYKISRDNKLDTNEYMIYKGSWWAKSARNTEITDFLRASEWEEKPKRAYDVGYGNIESLIKAGVAIDATTL